MKTSIELPDELAKELKEFNEQHPERKINLSGVCRKALRDILDKAKE